jgi:pimeloyl-ACP methyl ester carboxylesterase
MLSMSYAVRYPQYIAHLILVDLSALKTAISFSWSPRSSRRREANQRRAASPRRARGTEGNTETAPQFDAAGLRGYLSIIFCSPENRAVYLEQMKALPGGSAPGIFGAVNGDLDAKKYDLTPAAAETEIPDLADDQPLRHERRAAGGLQYPPDHSRFEVRCLRAQ